MVDHCDTQYSTDILDTKWHILSSSRFRRGWFFSRKSHKRVVDWRSVSRSKTHIICERPFGAVWMIFSECIAACDDLWHLSDYTLAVGRGEAKIYCLGVAPRVMAKGGSASLVRIWRLCHQWGPATKPVVRGTKLPDAESNFKTKCESNIALWFWLFDRYFVHYCLLVSLSMPLMQMTHIGR